MRRSGLTLFVAVSLLAVAAEGATHPHYGGTLRIAVSAAPMSLDPADRNQADSVVRRSLSRLVFDTLVILDGRGTPQPALATSWQSEPGNQRWQFSIRPGVIFHDGAPLSADAVAASLRAANPNWKVFAAGDAVVIQCESSVPNLPAELALARNGIAKRDGRLTGSGPFSVAQWDPGKQLTLAARNDYWGGRAFVDTIEIALGKNLREQTVALDLGKVDLIEIAPEQSHRAAAEGRRVESSAPMELLALVFSRDRQAPEEGQLRDALALSIDRGLINSVLLQGGGEPAGGLLPNWMSGYAFLFTTNVELGHARQIRSEVRQTPVWTLGYDAADPVARVIAERIALNAHDAGLTLQLTSSNAPSVRLARIPIASLDARVALTKVADGLGLPQPKFGGDSISHLYEAESALLRSQRVIPLAHLRAGSALGGSVRNWAHSADGNWQLQDVWLGAEKP